LAKTESVDARGLSCPQPVILARQAMQAVGSGTVTVVVDTVTSRDNVTRMAQRDGWKVASEPTREGDYSVVLSR